MIDDWHRQKTSGGKDDVAAEQFEEPDQTSLSSLPALHLESVRTDSNYERIVAERIVANDPQKDIHSLAMLTPADQYEKNLEFFRKIVEDFRYVPAEQKSPQ
jgi:hypothetical protein